MTRNKSRRDFVRTATATAVGLSAVGVASADSGPVGLSESFDPVSGEWQVESDMTTTSAGTPYDVGLVENRYGTDNHVQYVVDGTRNAGRAVWIRSTVDIEPDQAYEGELSLAAYTPEASYNQLSTLRAYVGPDRPRETDDFPDDVASWFYHSEVAGLEANPWETAGWEEHTQRWETPEFGTDELHVAVGFQTNWETEFEHLVDDITLTLEPKPE